MLAIVARHFERSPFSERVCVYVAQPRQVGMGSYRSVEEVVKDESGLGSCPRDREAELMAI